MAITPKKGNEVIRVSDFVSGYDTDLWTPCDLYFEMGKTYTLIGPNGCGKSTFLKCLAQVKEEYRGTIEVNRGGLINHQVQWVPLDQLESSDSQQIAWMPTFLNLQNWKVRDFLYTNYQSRWDWDHQLDEDKRHEFNEISEFLEITNFLDSKIEILSDGQKQRVMLAKVLGQKSRILLLDEPVSFIDLPHKYDFLKKLSSLKNQCVICSSHDIKLSLNFSDYILFIYNKQIVKMLPSEFYENPLVKKWLGHSIDFM